jgi:hypothetical protein
LENIYREFKQNMRRHGDYSKERDFYYREMEMRRKSHRPLSLKRFGETLYWILCGYAEKPWRIIAVSFLVILIGALAFLHFGITWTDPDGGPGFPNTIKYPEHMEVGLGHGFGYCFYYSATSFVLFSAGNVLPSFWSQVVATIEAFIGAFLLALFFFVFGRKLTR